MDDPGRKPARGSPSRPGAAAAPGDAASPQDQADEPEGLRDATPPAARYVFLEYAPSQEAPDCIEVLPEATDVWVGSPPSRIEWQVRDPTDSYQWVIDYKGPPEAESDLPVGKVVLPCNGPKAYRSPKAMKAGTWTYEVTVFECSAGRPLPAPVCERASKIVVLP